MENNVTWWSVPSSVFRQNERIVLASTMHTRSIQAPHSSVGPSVSFAFLPSPQITSGRPCPLVLHAFGCPLTPPPGGAPDLYQKRQSPQTLSRRPYAVAMLRRSPCASDPHTGHVPIRFRGLSIQPLSSKNPDIGFNETSGRSTQMRIRPTHSNSLRRRGGHGRQSTASLRDATTASLRRQGPRTCMPV